MLPGVNGAQFTAQRFEAEMVQLARDLALSMDASIGQRLECIKFVVQVARGVPTPWYNTGETIDPAAKTIMGQTIGETIEAARATSELFGRLDDLVRRGVPFADWPEDIKQLSEAAAFAELEGEPAALESPEPPAETKEVD